MPLPSDYTLLILGMGDNKILYPIEAIYQRNKVCCIAVITLRNIKSADQSYTEL